MESLDRATKGEMVGRTEISGFLFSYTTTLPNYTKPQPKQLALGVLYNKSKNTRVMWESNMHSQYEWTLVESGWFRIFIA